MRVNNLSWIVAGILLSTMVGCGGGGDESSPAPNPKVSTVQFDANIESDDGVYAGDELTATVTVENGTVSDVEYRWMVDNIVVGSEVSYRVKNQDWQKELVLCAAAAGKDEQCTDSYNVLAQHPMVLNANDNNYVIAVSSD